MSVNVPVNMDVSVTAYESTNVYVSVSMDVSVNVYESINVYVCAYLYVCTSTSSLFFF